ncbi:MAG: NfeD family protein [Chloroflexota bacterium]|nr:NfeD family protein [Anaerolineales bacterium]
MDFLLNPNVAYLILLGAVLLTMLAFASPGTGMLEVGAFFCMALAGYAIYNLLFNWWALLILVLGVVPFLYAIRKPKRELYLTFAILLFIVGSVFVFPRTGEQTVVNPLLAIAGSGSLAAFLWFAARKSIDAMTARPTHDLTGLVGQIGEARTSISAEGSVQVNGELWSARSESPIPAGSVIRVVRREGFVLVVDKNG